MSTLKVAVPFHVARRTQGRQEVCNGAAPPAAPPRLPRITRLMALALRFEQLIRDREVYDYAELAALGQVTRARVTQIMNLTLLAPDIQEALLFLPPVMSGRDPVILAHLQRLAAAPDWDKQRRLWTNLTRACGKNGPFLSS